MSNARLPMQHIREVLRLKHDVGLGIRPISRSLGLSRNTVRDYLARAQSAGLSYPLPPGLTDAELEKRLYPVPSVPATPVRPMPDCAYIHQEFLDYKKKYALTLQQLWIEYKDEHPTGYEYTQFCEYYRRWLGKRDLVMRQNHRPGERLFVDYTGGLSILSPDTGEIIPTNLFVAVWGASNFTYAEASLTQSLPDWIGAHTRALTFFGCVPRVTVPDNLKSGVHKADFYDPIINPTYAEFAEHYGLAVLPARPYKPRDKAKVENGVLVSKRWILAVLRHRVFHSLAELNAAIRDLLTKLNNRKMRKTQKSRHELFMELDRPAALPLPEKPYIYADWEKHTVNIDYHIEVDRHYYSVPNRLRGEEVHVRLTATTVEILHNNQRVAAHVRSHRKGLHTTLPHHMPPAHRAFAEWSPSRMVAWAQKTGPALGQLVTEILKSYSFPEQGYRASLGIIRAAKQFPVARAEAAARRAVQFHLFRCRDFRAILEQGLDKTDPASTGSSAVLPLHENIRGEAYYKN